MSLAYLLISQLWSYGIAWWLAFIGIAFVLARIGRIAGILLGQFAIAATIVVLDVRWIQSEMRSPGWNGQPDQDIVFMIGVLLRIVLINTVLLPISFIGLRMGHRPASNMADDHTNLDANG